MTEVLSPVSGTTVPMSEAPDQMFAEERIGAGVAIDPGSVPQQVLAPIDGKLLKIHPHAFVIMGGKVGILVHLGIDTVRLKGEGFTILAEEKSSVTAGTPVIEWDPTAADDAGYSTLVLVVHMESEPGSVVQPAGGTDVAPGEPLFTVA
ncbi:PTS sugar transporter subunit IIA [Actinomycetota bacterium]